MLGISRQRLRDGIREGRYPALQWSGRTMVDVDMLRPIIEAEEQLRRDEAARLTGLKTAAAAIGVSADALKRMAEAGVVPSVRRGRYWMFDLEQVEEAIRNRMT